MKLTLSNAKRLKLDYENLQQSTLSLNGSSYQWIRLFVVPSDYKNRPSFISSLLNNYFSSPLSDNPNWVYVNPDKDEHTVIVIAREVPVIPNMPEFITVDFIDAVNQNSIAFTISNYS
ncbi:MAG: hypothetical protein U0T74_13565 [Chitinophagales bacterium]